MGRSTPSKTKIRSVCGNKWLLAEMKKGQTCAERAELARLRHEGIERDLKTWAASAHDAIRDKKKQKQRELFSCIRHMTRNQSFRTDIDIALQRDACEAAFLLADSIPEVFPSERTACRVLRDSVREAYDACECAYKK